MDKMVENQHMEHSMTVSNKTKSLLPRWLSISIVVIGLDQLTKALASKHLIYATSVQVVPGLDLTLLHNTGAAFSLLAHAGGWQHMLFLVITLMVVGCLVYGLRQTTCTSM